jgi:hypothetical protein
MRYKISSCSFALFSASLPESTSLKRQPHSGRRNQLTYFENKPALGIRLLAKNVVGHFLLVATSFSE